MKVGDLVRVIKAPDYPSDDGVNKLIKSAVGKTFPIEGIEDGRLELKVNEVRGKGTYDANFIYLEPECVEIVEGPKRRPKSPTLKSDQKTP
jgi:hypothetical protein